MRFIEEVVTTKPPYEYEYRKRIVMDPKEEQRPCEQILPDPEEFRRTTTNEEQRAPLYTDDDLTAMATPCHDYSVAWLSGEKVRNFYEAKITSGELMVVKTIKHNVSSANIGECDLCHKFYGGSDYFCPGCGAKIIA